MLEDRDGMPVELEPQYSSEGNAGMAGKSHKVKRRKKDKYDAYVEYPVAQFTMAKALYYSPRIDSARIHGCFFKILLSIVETLAKLGYSAKGGGPNLEKMLRHNIGNLDTWPEKAEHTLSGPSPMGQETPTLKAPNLSPQNHALSISELHSLYTNGTTTPLRVVTRVLDIITSEYNAQNIFMNIDAAAILVSAKESTERYNLGTSLSPYDGVPIDARDEVVVQGLVTSMGSAAFSNRSPAKYSTWTVELLQSMGAIVIGSTTMDEGLLCFNGNNFTHPTQNPYNPLKSNITATNGSPLSVAYGLSLISITMDVCGTGLTAACCGVYVLRATTGSVPFTPASALVEASSSASLGITAANMDDVERTFLAIKHKYGSLPIAQMTKSPNVACKPIIGIYRPWFEDCERPVLRSCEATLAYFQDVLGVEIVDIEIPYIREITFAHLDRQITELQESLSTVTDKKLLRPITRLLMTAKKSKNSDTYHLCEKMNSLIVAHLSYLFQKFSAMQRSLVILSPTVGEPILPPLPHMWKGNVSDPRAFLNIRFVGLTAFSGCPAVSFPVNYHPDNGVPIGMQGISEWCNEPAAIQVARWAEDYLLNKVGGRIPSPFWDVARE